MRRRHPRRDEYGGRQAVPGPHCGTAVQLPYYYGRRRRPAAQRRPGQYPRRDHPLRAGADGLPQRDIPAGRSEPHRGERPPHHLRRTAEKGRKDGRFLLPRSRRRRGPEAGLRPCDHPSAPQLSVRPGEGYSGALPHEARPHRHPGPQRGAAGPAQPAKEGQAGVAERGPGLPGGGQSDAGAQ